MQQYLQLLNWVLEKGTSKSDRTGTGTLSCFGYQMRFDLSQGFPALTTKKLHFKSIIHELLWFLKGDTNIKYLQENGVHIWDEWADGKGELGPVYGKQWTAWKGYNGETYNQIQIAADQIKTLVKDPGASVGRRIIVSAWNVADLQNLIRGAKTSPPPCHLLFQFYVANGKLSCQLYQRSADVFLGVPFNIASYSLFTMMMAQVCDLKPSTFVHTLGDTHIYHNHFDQVKEQLSREPRSLPDMKINPEVKNIFDFKYEDFTIENYEPHPAIKAPIAI